MISSQNAVLNQYAPSFCIQTPVDGEALRYDSTKKSWVNEPIILDNTFLTLLDTPDTYSGDETKILAVNSAGDGVEFITAGTAGPGVLSVTAGEGLFNIGTAFDPILDVVAGAGISIVADAVAVDFSTASVINGTADIASRSDHTHNLGFLFDVDAATPNDGDILKYDLGSTTWITAPDTGGLVTSVFTRTGDITAEAGDYSTFYATTAQGALADSATQPADNISTLTNDLNFISDITAESIGDLSDVSTTGITNGQVLVWNTGAGEFQPGTPASPGEINTSSNLGGGAGLAATKSGVDLPFKSLVAGANVTLSSDANEVTINSVVTSAFESFRLDYGVFGTITSTSLLSSGITSATIVGGAPGQFIDLVFTYPRPPASIVYYGYSDLGANGFGYKQTMPASGSLVNEVLTGGAAGTPAELLTAMSPGKIRLQLRTSETFADSSEHAYVFLQF